MTKTWKRAAAAVLTASSLVLAAASPSSAASVRGAIADKWNQLGGPSSALGQPTSDEIALAQGAFNFFERGSIYWSPATGAHEVRGLIRDRWGSVGYEASVLGYPTTDEVPLPAKGGAFEVFQGGSIYYCPGAGAQIVLGAIREKWGQAGWENGVLGCPTSSEAALAGGADNHFQGGSIYWSPANGAHLVRGAIRDAWAARGWETSALGYPVTDEYDVKGGKRTRFVGGLITWTPERGAQVALTNSSTSYANCDAVRAAGAAPIYRGDPGYAPKLDGDGDGIGCEL